MMPLLKFLRISIARYTNSAIPSERGRTIDSAYVEVGSEERGRAVGVVEERDVNGCQAGKQYQIAENVKVKILQLG